MNDLISRAALFNSLANVKTLEEAFAVIQGMPAAARYTEDEVEKMQKLEAAEIQKAYELGREEGKPRWIPCAERLPENSDDVLITFYYGKEMHDPAVVKLVEDSPFFTDEILKCPHIGGAFYIERDDGNGKVWCCGIEGAEIPDGVHVTAWMPLPEPWKGEE